jgi:hypothetical protein
MAAPTAECPAEFISLAERLADATGRIVRHHFRSPLEIITKADDSPVTIADREAEKELRRMVALAYPQHGLIGEEFPAERRDADYVWVFDPIDGTKSFITGRPLFGTLIALLHRGRPILGIIDHPALGERWIGAAGHPSSFNGAPARVRPCAALAKACWRRARRICSAPRKRPPPSSASAPRRGSPCTARIAMPMACSPRASTTSSWGPTTASMISSLVPSSRAPGNDHRLEGRRWASIPATRCWLAGDPACMRKR